MHVVYEIACFYSFANESEQKQENKTFDINNHCEPQYSVFRINQGFDTSER